MSFVSLLRTACPPLTVVLLALVVLAGCSKGAEEPQFPAVGFGRTISLTVSEVQMKDAVFYQDFDGAFYVVTPSDPSRKLATVLVRVRNDKASTLLLDVQEGGFSLQDKEGGRHEAVNPFTSRQLAPNVPLNEPLFTFIWGEFEVLKNQAIEAWTLFDVPADITPSQFRWNTVETVVVRFFPVT